jgi:hypothetical protein
MILDKEHQLSDEQAVTAAAASTNVVDRGVASNNLTGKQLFVCITCHESAASAGASTVEFIVQKSSDNSTYTDAVKSGAIAKASLTAGMEPIFLPLPPNMDERYLRLYYNVETANLSAGKFSAHIVEGMQKNKAYADAI